MTDPIYVEITNAKHRELIAEFYGVAKCKERLDRVDGKLRAPGFAIAAAQVDLLEAEMRNFCVAENFRAVARAGVDITQVANITLEQKGNTWRLVCKMMDLADLAEGV